MPLTVLVVAGAAWAFRLGWIAATISETDVIERYVDRYLSTAGSGARATDCSAQPGKQAQVWILVSCVAPDDERVDYPVDRMGRLLDVSPQSTRVEAPEA